MRKSRQAELEAEEQAAQAELCLAKSENIRALCKRARGHVLSLEPEHWHQTTATETVTTTTNSFEMTRKVSEVMRWRPHAYEIVDREQAAKEFAKELNLPHEQA